MALQFVLGRAGSGKTEYCVKKAASLESQGKRVLMIVPEQFSHQGESLFLKEKGYLHEGFSVTSFARLARKVIQKEGMAQKGADNAEKAMLVYKAILNCKNKLVFFRSAEDKPSYIALFMDAISEFKKGQVTEEALFSAAEKAENPLFSAKLSDLAQIYKAYNELLSDTLSDPDDNLTILSNLAPSNDTINNSAVFIDSFYRFTQNELSCIRAFLLSGADVTITLCMPDEFVLNSSVFDSVQKSKESIERLAKEVGAEILSPVVLSDTPRFSSEELHVLERAFSGKNEKFSGVPENISLFAAKNKYEEVMHAATEICDYVQKSGASYRDIAVIAGDYKTYADLISTVFPMYDLPIFADVRHDVLSHPIVLYLFSVFDLLESITTKKIVSYMKSGFASVTGEEAALLENYALSSAIEYGDWLDDARFLHKITNVFETEAEGENPSEDFVALKKRVLSPVLKLKARFSESKSARARIEALLDFLNDEHFSEKILEKIEYFKAHDLLRFSEEYTEVNNILIDTIEKMRTLLGENTIGIKGMRAILEAGLSERSLGVIPTVYDQISFGDLNRSVIKNARALFVLGANDMSFPAVPSPNPLLTDDEREFLNESGVHVAPKSANLISDAEFSVYAALTTAQKALFISYSISDESGGSLRPALCVGKLRRIFPNLKLIHELDLLEPSAEMTVASKQSAYQYLLTRLFKIDTDEMAHSLYEALKKDPEYKAKLERAHSYARFENKSDPLSKDTVKALYGNTLYGSASRFERFAACPFSFFVEYGLKAKERKVLKVEAPDIGSLLHEVIELFSREVRARGLTFGNITKEEQEEMISRIIDEMFGAMYIKNIYSKNRLLALKTRMKSLVSKSVWALCKHVSMGEFEPTAFEIAFDKNGEMPPVTIPLPDGGEIVLTGRIDRIDTLSHEGKLYLKIIDYKSGAKRYSLSDIFNGTTLQLAVYMLAATNGFPVESGRGAQIAGMFYFHLDDPIEDGFPEDAPDEMSRLKPFKMSGLAIDKPEIVQAMDKSANQWSAVIPVYIKGDGSLSKSLSKSASAEEFEKLKRHIKKTVTEIGTEIMSGNVEIRPVRDGKLSPCSYCKYRIVCGFDPNEHPCRRTQNLKDEEIWEKL